MKPRVAFQGELGAFSEEALRRMFGEAAEPLPRREFADVGRAVATGGAEYGLLPIENTLAGSIGASYALLGAGDLEVVGEVVLPIHHCVLGRPGATLEGLTRVISHPVALAQCTRFLRGHSGVVAAAVYDTAGAAREVADADDLSVAAIASRGAADRYGLQVLASNVEDRPDNQTRFLLLQRAGAGPGPLPDRGAIRTLVLVDTPNTPGSLVGVLRPLADHGINIGKLEARPGEEPWTSRFFLELEADFRASPAAQEAIRKADRVASSIRVLGVYPRVGSGAPRGATASALRT